MQGSNSSRVRGARSSCASARAMEFRNAARESTSTPSRSKRTAIPSILSGGSQRTLGGRGDLHGHALCPGTPRRSGAPGHGDPPAGDRRHRSRPSSCAGAPSRGTDRWAPKRPTAAQTSTGPRRRPRPNRPIDRHLLGRIRAERRRFLPLHEPVMTEHFFWITSRAAGNLRAARRQCCGSDGAPAGRPDEHAQGPARHPRGALARHVGGARGARAGPARRRLSEALARRHLDPLPHRLRAVLDGPRDHRRLDAAAARRLVLLPVEDRRRAVAQAAPLDGARVGASGSCMRSWPGRDAGAAWFLRRRRRWWCSARRAAVADSARMVPAT